jgi:phosphatidate cytidylyltransferase
MLKWRVLTALVLIPPLLAAPFLLSTIWLAPLFGLIVVAGGWEWATLSGVRSLTGRLAYIGAIVVLGTALLTPFLADPRFTRAILIVGIVFWLWAFATLVRGDGWKAGVFRGPALRRLSGVLTLVPCWLAALYLHARDPQRPWLLLYSFVLVWAADTFAYFSGTLFGRHKLAPAISPGKTIEGLAGALIGCTLFAFICGTMFWKFEGVRLAAWVALAVATVLMSVVGDLVESKLKRLAGVKDSGRLLPGHGGALDRLDSYTAAAPLFALGWTILIAPSL